MDKPYLLIDVDGVLNPIGRRVLPGFTRHMIEVEGNTFPVDLNPDHGKWFEALAEKFELVWATTWEDHANDHIGPKVGIPELPVIHLDDYETYGHELLAPIKFGMRTWMNKCPSVLKFVGDRAFLWFDDTFNQHDYEWGRKRTESGLPTYLRWIDDQEGIRKEDVDSAIRWADLLAAGEPIDMEPTDAT